MARNTEGGSLNKGHWDRGRSSLALDILVRKESDKEFLMSQRNARRYWGNKHDPLYGPCSSFSKWLYHKKARKQFNPT